MQLFRADAWRVLGVEGKNADAGHDRQEDDQEKPFQDLQNRIALLLGFALVKASHPGVFLV